MKNKPQNKFKLTPDAYNTLELLANSLPKFQRRDKLGNLIWRATTEFKGTKDFNESKKTFTKIIQPGREPLLVNHHVNLREIYQKDGNKGVEAYVKFFTEEMEKAKKEQEEKKYEKRFG